MIYLKQSLATLTLIHASNVQLDQWDRQDQMVHQDHKDQTVTQAHKVCLENKAHQVPMARQVL